MPYKNRAAFRLPNKLFYGVVLALILLPWGAKLLSWRKVKNLEESILKMQKERQKLLSDMRSTQAAWKKNTKDAEAIEEESNELLKELRSLGDEIDVEDKQYLQAEVEEEHYLDRIKQLEKAIQTASNRHLKEKYGLGPYLVLIKLTENVGGFGDTIVIETARQDLMPHSIELFMNQIEGNIWDGASLYHKLEGSNLIQAMTLSSETLEWKEQNLPTLVFNEHDPEYPIQKYSVAFKGRPAGPEFFINMDHQFRSHEIDQNESCFGRVVEGRPILDHILQESRETKGLVVKGYLVGIKYVRVMKNKRKPSE